MIFRIIVLSLFCAALHAQTPERIASLVQDAGIAEMSTEPSCGWANVSIPSWFTDARLGVMLCWGPNSVPEYDLYGLYFRSMYTQGGNELQVYDYHSRVYGHPTRFGYKDLIPLWKGEKWEPEKLADFFKENGFKYLVATAAFHDNFDCYDSSHQSWNSVKMGIKRDVIGEWKSAAEKAGLPFGVYDGRGVTGLLCRARNSDVIGFRSGKVYDGRLKAADGKGLWWEGYDPQELYYSFAGSDSDEVYAGWWWLRAKEIVDKYQPQLYFMDAGGMPFGRTGEQFFSYFIDKTEEPVAVLKGVAPQRAIVANYDIKPVSQVMDMPWQTTSTLISTWYYRPDRDYLDVNKAVLLLMDVVSRNGNLLINVALDETGQIPEQQRETLEGLGDWLRINGEAVYGCRAWHLSGYGKTMRFTCCDNKLYVFVPALPVKKLNIPVLGRAYGVGMENREIRSVDLLGKPDKVVWERTEKGLSVEPPEKKSPLVKIPKLKKKKLPPGFVYRVTFEG